MITESMPSSAYTALAGDSFRPSSLTRGPWHPDHQHAGPPIALMCRAIENTALKTGLTHLSRLTANLLRPVPIRDLEIEVITNYVGRNSGHFSARLKADDKEVALVTALARREHDVKLPDGLPGHPLPGAPRPADDSLPAIFPFHGKQVGYAIWWRSGSRAARSSRAPVRFGSVCATLCWQARYLARTSALLSPLIRAMVSAQYLILPDTVF